uniref:Uncharacterized protein n=1 Tax=Oryza sativa subsp. japonica TaxID=39947 RepID=Q6YVB8_ORYSJ|nr:hypothetical protein [Oryza sativa Japonica Group]
MAATRAAVACGWKVAGEGRRWGAQARGAGICGDVGGNGEHGGFGRLLAGMEEAAACRRSERSPAITPSSISFAATRGGPAFASRRQEPTGAPSSSRTSRPAPRPSFPRRQSSLEDARAVFPRRHHHRPLPLAAMVLGELFLRLPSFFPSSTAPLACVAPPSPVVPVDHSRGPCPRCHPGRGGPSPPCAFPLVPLTCGTRLSAPVSLADVNDSKGGRDGIWMGPATTYVASGFT